MTDMFEKFAVRRDFKSDTNREDDMPTDSLGVISL